jgi:phosphoribosylformylglycinamidine synthase
MARYRAFAAARDAGLVRSAHVVGRGGLAVALTHMALAGELGLDIDVASVLGDSPGAALFSESTGRIVLTCAAHEAGALAQALAGHGLRLLGTVAPPRAGEAAPAVTGGLPPPTGGWLRIASGAQTLLEHDTASLRRAFQRGGDHV